MMGRGWREIFSRRGRRSNDAVRPLDDVLEAEVRPNTLVALPTSSKTVAIQTLRRRESPWIREVPEAFRAVPGKPPLDFDGRPLYAEFILLRLLERAGWSGVWVKNWGGRAFWRDLKESVALPPHEATLLRQIERCTGGSGAGCWDIVAWRDDNVLFIESKQHGRDALRPNQVRWLECALRQGVPLSSFAIAEWTRMHLPRHGPTNEHQA